METVKGKKILISGAAGGIGKATALLMAEEGASVYLTTGSNRKGLDQVIKTITDKGGEAFGAAGDIRDINFLKEVAKDAAEKMRGIDVLVNNAGLFQEYNYLEQGNEQILRDAIDVNLMSVWNFTQTVVPYMLETGGAIVNISSVDAFAGCKNYAPYAMAKAGVVGLTKTLAGELGSYGIRVNAVAPGITRTALVEDRIEKFHEKYVNESPLRTIGEAEDIANAILFLSCKMSRYITGQVIHPNGGCYCA